MSGAAPKERIHTFFVLKAPDGPERVIVWDTQDVSVGRAPENDICVDSGELSRRHAHFSRLKNACVVKNLSTSNGTFVNGQQISSHSLQHDDVVQMADVEMHFHQGTQNPATLGAKLEYVSQLKDFGPAHAVSASPDSTVLGLMDSVADTKADDFEVRPASDFEYDLHGLEDMGPGPATRNLDLEIQAPGIDDLQMPEPEPEPWTLDDEPAAEAQAPPVPAGPAPEAEAAPAPPKPAPAVEAAAPPAKPPPAVEAVPPPAQRAAKPVVRPATRPPPAAKAVPGALRLEIEGLDPALAQRLEALIGQVLELPKLRVRVVRDRE